MQPFHSAALLLTTALTAIPGGAALADGTRSLSGSALYLERIALPPDAELSVEAFDFAGSSLAFSRRPTEGAQVPLPFGIEIPTSVSAELRIALSFAGEARWVSEPLEIGPGADSIDLGEIVLGRFTPMAFPSEFLCGETRLRVGFQGEKALLETGDQVIELAQAVSASGARFLSADGKTEFWNKGDKASVTLDGTQLPECSLVPYAVDNDWVASGNEPFWRLASAGQVLTLSGLDRAELTGPLTAPVIEAGAFHYRPVLTGPEGEVQASLTVTEQVCRDTMTGMPHPQTVALQLGDENLAGCGGDPVKLLIGAEWQIEDITGGGIIDRSNVTIRFDRDGTVSGAASCNRFTGMFMVSGEGLDLARLAGTMMACPEALMAQEARVHEALGRVTGFDIDETGALLLKAGDETVLLARR